MIFVTVGAQMPFDRLIRAVDSWANARGRGSDVFAQIGADAFLPQHVRYCEFLEPPEFYRCVRDADVIVAHAGMGSILTALERGKPIIVMPRRGDLNETRNDHQLATARQLEQQGRVRVAYDERELPDLLDSINTAVPGPLIQPYASDRLLDAIRSVIADPGCAAASAARIAGS
jgi:UDP-N-acetylglucosamine transferase subunit ALG13